jgi:group I intron endonuclease
MVGIYKINSPSNKVYIGQSWDISSRKSVYKSVKCKGQRKLYESLKKYGWENHSFEVVHELPGDITQDILDAYEIIYFNFYQDAGHNMMNVRTPGKGGKLAESTKHILSLINTGKKYSEEINRKKSRPGSLNGMYGRVSPLKGKKLSESEIAILKNYWTEDKKIERSQKYFRQNNPNSKPIDQYDKSGTFIKSWPCITTAELKLQISHIGSVCKGTRQSAGGFIWTFSK